MNEKLLKVKQLIEVFRDIGLIIGVPTIIIIGIGLYERQIDVLKAENELLKKSQYDRAWALIDSQKKIFENERDLLVSKIANVEKSEQSKNAEIAQLNNKLIKVNRLIESPEDMFAVALLSVIANEYLKEIDDVEKVRKSESSKPAGNSNTTE